MRHGDKERLFEGGGETGELMRAFDWASTPLGPVAGWSQALRTVVGLLLKNRFPLILMWGPKFIQFYNDAYRPITGAKHPKAIGQAAQECWEEIWHVIGPLIETPFSGGPASVSDDLALLINRRGFLEETHFKIAASPVPDETVTGTGVGGVLWTVAETTEQVQGDRQLRMLRELGARAADAKTAEEACEVAAATLKSDPYDVPFALLYLLHAGKSELRLVSECGFEGVEGTANLRTIEIDDPVTALPVADVVRNRTIVVIEDLLPKFGSLPSGGWSHPPRAAIALPLASPEQAHVYGVLIAGVSPHREIDEGYRGFFELVAGQIETAIRNARAYEQERLRAEKLAEIDRAKTAFFSNVSHEFRTPLTLMLGPLEDLLSAPKEALPPSLRAEAEVAHRNAVRLLKLVNSLLDFSRIEAGRISAAFQPTDLSQFTSELAALFRSAIEKAGLRFTVDCPAMDEPVYVDRAMWEKIVLNLISNAFKFTFHGEITVRLRASAGKVELSVGDTGTGIPADELPHVFERFHRVEGARGRTYEGAGIGLALVNELVKLHQGRLWAESAVGAGTTFFAEIPLGTAHLPEDRIVQPQQVLSSPAGGQAYVEEALGWLRQDVEDGAGVLATSGSVVEDTDFRPCILLADDNLDMRGYVRHLLSGRYEVMEACDGQDALEAIAQRVPDVVLTDVMMPRMNGFELLSKLRADPRTAMVPVIMISARAGEESKVEGLDAGADDYLIKPFSARELLARIHANLTLARAREAAARHAAELQAAEERDRLRDKELRQEQGLRAEAEIANRLKDEFIATISHELRTPLTSIHGWTQVLLKSNVDEATRMRGLDTIDRNTRLQISLIEDLLDVSRILTGKLRLEVQQVDLAPVIDDLMHSVQLAADAKAITVTTDVDPGAGPILGDADRLRQIVLNLLNNALKFTSAGGRVHVRLARVDSHVELSVADTGRGISAGFLPHIFERFRQQDGSDSREFGGLGLGLAIVKSLVELHGGKVEAMSKGEGHGAKFTVKIPLLEVRVTKG